MLDREYVLQRVPDFVRATVRYIYRDFMRATSYLPDRFAREYMRSYISRRFHEAYPRDVKDIRSRLPRMRQMVRKLQRAGDGNLTDLTKVLQFVYGRAGKKRRQLVDELLKPDEDNVLRDSVSLERFIEEQPAPPESVFSPSQKLLALMKSQIENHPPENPRPKLRSTEPKLTYENSWGRPLPKKLKKNLQHKFWKDAFDRLLPPLPAGEWDRLRDFATGKVPIEPFPQRRLRQYQRRIVSTADLTDEELMKAQFNHESHTVRWNPVVDEAHGNMVDRNNAKENQRAMRRVYASIWSLCPKMTQDPISKKWSVEWGGGRSAASKGQITVPDVRDVELFEGIHAENSEKDNRLPSDITA
ncbi:hypothetical protein F5884DRAFT_674972 [Xylogone sp. PMI_703]|nr:hypothetical protein F5884DRAFT_674972 [Xylogone sp. PMI_703]